VYAVHRRLLIKRVLTDEFILSVSRQAPIPAGNEISNAFNLLFGSFICLVSGKYAKPPTIIGQRLHTSLDLFGLQLRLLRLRFFLQPLRDDQVTVHLVQQRQQGRANFEFLARSRELHLAKRTH
jgi:hypothetical protein